MDRRPIGFLDSGVGGLSLLKAAKRLLPDERFLMLADSRYFPYGDSEPARVCERAECLSRFLIERDTKLIVVACNTASVHALAHLRRVFPAVPFVGVVPVVKTLARQTHSGTIALLSTPATAESSYLAGLIGEFAAGLQVVNIACPGLAELVEAGETSGSRTFRLLEQYLAAVRSSEADVLGLGCTHYLFLRSPIRRILGAQVRVFDPARPVARRIRQVLSERSQLADGVADGDVFYSTGEAARFAAVARRFLRRRALQVESVDI